MYEEIGVFTLQKSPLLSLLKKAPMYVKDIQESGISDLQINVYVHGVKCTGFNVVTIENALYYCMKQKPKCPLECDQCPGPIYYSMKTKNKNTET